MGKTKQYDLEDRTLKFSKDVINLINNSPGSLTNDEIAKQLVRSSCSVGANYIEANEAINKKDFIYRIKICRKEIKESRYWLNLILTNEKQDDEHKKLIQESTELMKIFGSIIVKSSK